jgi:hypothetical protein
MKANRNVFRCARLALSITIHVSCYTAAALGIVLNCSNICGDRCSVVVEGRYEGIN